MTAIPFTPSPGGLATLQRHYEDPLLAARKARENGAGVVGLLGATGPVELVLAAGRFPVRIRPDLSRPTPTASLYMDDIISPETKAVFEAAIDGDFAAFDLLVFGRGDDKLYYYLKEVVRLGRAPLVPAMQIVDIMSSQREAVREYNLKNFTWLIETLERVAGHEITDSAVREALALTNRSRRLQRRLLDLRWTGRVAGSDALQAIGAGYFMHPADYAEALEIYLSDIESANAEPAKGPRVLISTSEPLTQLALHRRLEAAGALVVTEDDQWGARAAGERDAGLAGSAREAVFQKYWLDTPHSGVYPPEAREDWLQRQIARDDLDGVVFYVPPSDQQFGWDYPRLAADVKARGKLSTMLRQDAARDSSMDAQIKAFVAELNA